MGISLWLVEGVPIKMTWMNPMRMSLSKWSDLIELKWIERFEVIWVNWRKWARTTLWESPYGWLKVSLSKWLDLFVVTKSFQNEWNRWDLNELKWIEWNEVKWRIWRIWLCKPYEKVPMVGWRCPYQSDLICLLWPNPFKMNGINEKWVNRVKWDEMSDLKDLTLWTLWESPYGRKRVSLWEWLGWTLWECPYQNEWIQWEMSE